MIIRGREVKFLRTVKTACELAKMCPGGDLANLDALFTGNIADINEYIKGIESGARNFEIEHLTEEERYNDAILTRLRTANGLPLAWMQQKFSEKLNIYMQKAADKHIACGNLKMQEGSLSLTEKGIFISDAIIRDLIYIA